MDGQFEWHFRYWLGGRSKNDKDRKKLIDGKKLLVDLEIN